MIELKKKYLLIVGHLADFRIFERDLTPDPPEKKPYDLKIARNLEPQSRREKPFSKTKFRFCGQYSDLTEVFQQNSRLKHYGTTIQPSVGESISMIELH